MCIFIRILYFISGCEPGNNYSLSIYFSYNRYNRYYLLKTYILILFKVDICLGGTQTNNQFLESVQDVLAKTSEVLFAKDLPESEELMQLRQFVETLKKCSEQDNFLEIHLNLTSIPNINEKEFAPYLENMWESLCLNATKFKMRTFHLSEILKYLVSMI